MRSSHFRLNSTRLLRTLNYLPGAGLRGNFVTHRRGINERSHDRRSLLHIVTLDPIEDVLIRVMRASVVFNLILNGGIPAGRCGRMKDDPCRQC